MPDQAVAMGIVAARVRLFGHVQGIGVRPAIYNLAQQMQLSGRVVNDATGVDIFIQGTDKELDEFRCRLVDSLPGGAHVERLDWEFTELEELSHFRIVQSNANSRVATHVPSDRKVCDACLEEMFDSKGRRHHYPFTSCTQCGPRYSIIDQMPYERRSTTMTAFPLCQTCNQEYATSSDRRFHAQTNACAECGPRVKATMQGSQTALGDAAIQMVVEALHLGRIVALKGIGGYQLLVDATNEQAVQTLRNRKGRPEKPLAVMISATPKGAGHARLLPDEQESLRSWENPIVLTRNSGLDLAASVSCGLRTVGVLEPTTPLHALLSQQIRVPLVVTSGNREGNPLAITPTQAECELSDMADVWLHHDRTIAHPIDDSVVRVMAGRQVTIRLARGLAPLPLSLPAHRPGLAIGGHQAVAIALTNGSVAVLGPHLGDLDSLAMRERFESHVDELTQLYDCQPEFIACDWHPDYFSSRWAQQCGGQQIRVGSRPSTTTHLATTPSRCLSSVKHIIRVQHHHAHIAAGMLEQGWHDETVLGIAFDGTGYGDDDSIWGGEFLLCSLQSFERVGHLRPFVLPGGEIAIRQPWRVALSLLSQIMEFDAAVAELSELIPTSVDVERLRSLLKPSQFSPRTTSAGRLFDGIAALALGVSIASFEGQPALLLDDACDDAEVEGYKMPLVDGQPFEIDWRGAVRELLRNARQGVSPNRIAMRFHRGLADAMISVCRLIPEHRIVLGGGVFQNQHLVEILAADLPVRRLGLPGAIPPNDGGLAAGQLAVAVSWLESTSITT